ncbi:MAG: sll0787 family AIR synthase-like protein [Hydrogenophaga sp.]|uniref:sll0787 family AIR synthase-like protein n=1 Tax=Hydrogenophaga sp. TaxID=1904254 RepID=UPI0025C4EA82|nr:sll0787 family AIR synthase-like protein [Hydrogenophaga sp.]MBT9549955.1 sll0787 family AIR synthase-like protein [Hydrogenophaga sp.]
MTPVEDLVARLRASRGFTHKRDIAGVMAQLAPTTGVTAVPNGDDCAVLPDPSGTGHVLLAIEGLVQDLVESMPWFAGYSAVMVNLSDVAAMGGRAVALVDALWASSEPQARDVLAGMRAAAERYGVPLVGGHTNLQSASGQLAVAVLGRAQRLISSFAARPGDHLLVAVDLRGQWQAPYPFWNASTEAPAERLRGDMELLPQLAEAGWCDAGKDISMAGVLGSILMLLECSGVGAEIHLDDLPRPVSEIDLGSDSAVFLRWLCAFPSFGYVLSVRPEYAERVRAHFGARNIACADVGTVCEGSRLRVSHEGEQALLWDHAQTPFITSREPS